MGKYETDESLRLLSDDIDLYGEGRIIGGARGHINKGVRIQAFKGYKVILGDRVRIGPYTQIMTASHPADQNFAKSDIHLKRRAGDVVIEDNVWIASYCIIMPGVTIGKNTVVCAYSYVNEDMPAYAVVRGRPARVWYFKGCKP